MLLKAVKIIIDEDIYNVDRTLSFDVARTNDVLFNIEISLQTISIWKIPNIKTYRREFLNWV